MLDNMVENTKKNKKAKEEQNNENSYNPKSTFLWIRKTKLYECRGTWTTLSLKQIRPLRRVLEVTLDVRLPGYNDNDVSTTYYQNRLSELELHLSSFTKNTQ